MNLNSRMRKLQRAIVKTGFVVKLNTNQFYSAEQKRMITSYVLSTPAICYSERKKEWKIMDYEILKTCSIPEIIYCLVDIYKVVKLWS